MISDVCRELSRGDCWSTCCLVASLPHPALCSTCVFPGSPRCLFFFRRQVVDHQAFRLGAPSFIPAFLFFSFAPPGLPFTVRAGSSSANSLGEGTTPETAAVRGGGDSSLRGAALECGPPAPSSPWQPLGPQLHVPRPWLLGRGAGARRWKGCGSAREPEAERMGPGAPGSGWGQGKGHSSVVIGLSLALGTEVLPTWGERQLVLAEAKCP